MTVRILQVAVIASALIMVLNGMMFAPVEYRPDAPGLGSAGAATRPTPIYRQRGVASAYGPGLYGNGTACGRTMHPDSVWVANRSLPCGTLVQICSARRCAVLPVRDRGPYVDGRDFDISAGALRMYWGVGPYTWGVRSISWRRIR